MGASVVNALSSWLEVSIVRDGIEYQEKFKDGGKPDGTLKNRKDAESNWNNRTFQAG